jgi:hypothetical protein
MTFVAPPGGFPTAGWMYSGSYTVRIDRDAEDDAVWVVPFKVRQRGEPHTGTGEGRDFAAAETAGTGKVFFKSRPRESASGSVAAHVTHSDDWLEATLTSYGQTVTLAPMAGEPAKFFSPHAGFRKLVFRFVVKRVTFDGSRRPPDPLNVGDTGAIGLYDDEDRGDSVAITFYDDHSHRSKTDRKDTVKVIVGKPRKVGG